MKTYIGDGVYAAVYAAVEREDRDDRQRAERWKGMSKFYERGCKCPEIPCPYHPTPNRPFDKMAEVGAEDYYKALKEKQEPSK